VTGPPHGGEFLVDRQLWVADIPTLPVKVMYAVHADLAEPAIAVRHFIRY
jgi:hypothetical protein